MLSALSADENSNWERCGGVGIHRVPSFWRFLSLVRQGFVGRERKIKSVRRLGLSDRIWKGGMAFEAVLGEIDGFYGSPWAAATATNQFFSDLLLFFNRLRTMGAYGI